MAADLHIHVAKDIPEKELEAYGKRWFTSYQGDKKTFEAEDGTELFFDEDKIQSTPSIWIGEVSWLKASILEDADTFIPGPVQAVQHILNDMPVINDEVIQKIAEALKVENKTTYSVTEDHQGIIDFLEQNKGERIFGISW